MREVYATEEEVRLLLVEAARRGALLDRERIVRLLRERAKAMRENPRFTELETILVFVAAQSAAALEECARDIERGAHIPGGER